MIGKGQVEHLGTILEEQADVGIGILGLWVNWTHYRHQPVLFSGDLQDLDGQLGREDAALAMNMRWGGHGVAALVHRRREIQPYLAGDPSAWLETELREMAQDGQLEDFMATVGGADHARCFAVLILADEAFPYDGKSKSEWQHAGRSLPIAVHDSETALPAGLGRLKHYDDLFQIQIALLQTYLCKRWQEKCAKDESGARAFASEVVDEFVSRNGAKRARAFAILNGEGKQLSPDELRLVRERAMTDLAGDPSPPAKLRLSSKNTGLLSWFIPTRGGSTESPAKLFARCFGPPHFAINAEDSLASAMLNSLDDTERARASADTNLGSSIHTLVTAMAAMKLSNIFAHEDQYRFQSPTFVLQAICKSELRNLERVNAAWRF